MPILHFDTEAGTTTVTTINTCKANIQNELTTINSKVMNLTSGEWRSQSASDFQSEVQQWKTQLDTSLNNLDILRQKLEREIQEWLQVAQNFG